MKNKDLISGMAYAIPLTLPYNEGGHNMGYLIDFFYLMKEFFKLLFLVLISPLGLLAGYLFSWE
ncbi:hypothetical protein [Methylophaga sp.]|uniref:hypothetical protein n=1 Tax=Methylophaga sp. TaxID=2024840 RepID=UPI00272086EB|nr:hypothetical protein [Methylophaga sp.]MDO8826392.1 hypothetical protein [Methylophaga sp.]